MTELRWEAPIRFTNHSLDRIHERVGPLDTGLIRGEIRSAVLADRVAAVPPYWTRHPERRSTPSAGFRYAWDLWRERCWVLGVTSDGVLSVLTVLLPLRSSYAVQTVSGAGGLRYGGQL